MSRRTISTRVGSSTVTESSSLLAFTRSVVTACLFYQAPSRHRNPFAGGSHGASPLHGAGGEALYHVPLEAEHEQDGRERAQEPGSGDHRVVDVDLPVHAGDHRGERGGARLRV